MDLDNLIRRVDGHNSCIPPWKLRYLWDCVRDTPPGDILEVGSWKGGSSLIIAAAASQFKPNAHVYICDTFEGIVGVTDKDNFHIDGHFGGNSTSKELVENLIAEHSLTNATVHKGIFPKDTGHEIMSNNISFIHVDVDVYQGHVDIFNWMIGKLAPGAKILFDDYANPDCAGATQAVHEFFDNRDDFTFTYNRLPQWHQAYVIYNPK